MNRSSPLCTSAFGIRRPIHATFGLRAAQTVNQDPCNGRIDTDPHTHTYYTKADYNNLQRNKRHSAPMLLLLLELCSFRIMYPSPPWRTDRSKTKKWNAHKLTEIIYGRHTVVTAHYTQNTLAFSPFFFRVRFVCNVYLLRFVGARCAYVGPLRIC